MKYRLASVVVLFFCTHAVRAQKIAGDWTGTLHANKDLRLELRVKSTGDADWTASLISVDQSDKEIPVDAFWVRDKQVIFTVRQIGGSFEGSFDQDNRKLTGYWLQGVSIPLDFTKRDLSRN